MWAEFIEINGRIYPFFSSAESESELVKPVQGYGAKKHQVAIQRSQNQKPFFRHVVSFVLNLQMPEEQQIKVNNHIYKVSMNDQTRMYAMKLRRLYQQTYSDVDSFDELSSEISSTLNNLLKFALSPEVLEEDMDGTVKQLLGMIEKTQKK